MATKIVYDQETMKKMALFETITHAKVKDFFDDEIQGRLVFIVQPGNLWKALGKKGANVKKLEEKFKRKIKVVEFSEDKLEFIKNMVQPLRVSDVTEDDDGIVTIKHEDMQVKGLLIGKNARNLRNLENNVRRFYEVKEIKVM
ncbi:NusA-like transcription termination signal-binding factor [Candidatus Woesearchaeota archaeon]|nr:NusA-like transcription termination signal-binding factor [Candidatus Woesearchaeota archaeon]